MNANSADLQILEYRGGKNESIVTSRFQVAMVTETRWVRHGTFDAYFNDGRPRASGQFEQGRMEGQWRFFHYEGVIAEEGRYTNSQRVGRWRFYTRHGALERESEYIDGRRDGHTTYYDEAGRVKSEGRFENGRPVGVWRVYGADGTGYDAEVEAGNEQRD